MKAHITVVFNSNFSLSIDGEGVSAARDAMQAISQVAEETRFTNNINLEFRGMDNVFSLKGFFLFRIETKIFVFSGFGVFKTKSDLRELEKELEQHSLADFDRLFLIHHSNPLRCKVHQRLTETSHFQVPFSTLLSTLHFAAQVEPFRLLPTELQQKREQLPSEMFSISRKSKTLPVAEYELHELLQENVCSFFFNSNSHIQTNLLIFSLQHSPICSI